jgi:hypothetical protein
MYGIILYFSLTTVAQMVKDTSILGPLSPARTEILKGNRSRVAGEDLKWQESVAKCKLTLHRLYSRCFEQPLTTGPFRDGGEQFLTSPPGGGQLTAHQYQKSKLKNPKSFFSQNTKYENLLSIILCNPKSVSC